MIVMLTPDQVSKQWDVLKVGIQESLPDGVGDSEIAMQNVMLAIMNGSMQVWVDHRKDSYVGMAVTTFISDPGTNNRSLLIYAVYRFGKYSINMLEGLKELKGFAKRNMCSHLVAYTNREDVLRLSKSLGGNLDWTLISFEAEDEVNN